ncbi:unnamed protein product, partial [Nesidiocoris tenuis]
MVNGNHRDEILSLRKNNSEKVTKTITSFRVACLIVRPVSNQVRLQRLVKLVNKAISILSASPACQFNNTQYHPLFEICETKIETPVCFRSRDIPRTVPEEKIVPSEPKAGERVPIKDEPEVVLRLEAPPETLHSNGTALYSGAKKRVDSKNKPEIKPKPPDPSRKHSASTTNLYKSNYKESYSINNNNRLSLPKVTILDDLLDDKVKSKKPNSSFLWGGLPGKNEESQKRGDEMSKISNPETIKNHIEEPIAQSKPKPAQPPNDERDNFKIPLRPQSLINLKANVENDVTSEKNDVALTPTSLVANKSSLYRDLGRSQESISSLKKSQENLRAFERSQESIVSESRSLQDVSQNSNRFSGGSQSSLETVRSSADLPREPMKKVPLAEDRCVIQKNEAPEPKKSLDRVPSIRSNASYEDIGNYKYEDVVENSYTVIGGDYDDTEAIYDDVLNHQGVLANEGNCFHTYKCVSNRVRGEICFSVKNSKTQISNSNLNSNSTSDSNFNLNHRQWREHKRRQRFEFGASEQPVRPQAGKSGFFRLEEKAKPKVQHDSWSQRVRRQWSHRLAEEFKTSR